MKRLRLLFFLCIAALCARPADAQRAYFDGIPQSTSTNCPVTGTLEEVLHAYTGYFTDPGEPYPKTGDIAYVHAVGINMSNCVNDVFGPEFFLPDGASLAISATNPVYCIRGRLDGTLIPPDSTLHCSQTPSAGSNGGLFFGWSPLAPETTDPVTHLVRPLSNWWLEVQVPVVFNKKLLGIAGPTSHRLTVAASSAYSPYVVYPYQPVTVFYQAAFANLASSAITSSAANLLFDLKSYFHDGTLYVDYATTNPPPQNGSATSIANTALSFPITASLSGLSASTPYFWRARFVTTTDGTFTSSVQAFTTTSSGAAQMLTVSTFGAGTVTSNPTGINCGLTCSASFPSGNNVILTASPATGSFFSGWSGSGCSGTGTCTVTMNAAKSVSAGFLREFGSLSLTLGGLPAGSSVTLGITGPDGFNTTRTMTTGFGTNFSDVGTGTYTVTAPLTTVAGSSYAPNAASQNAVVTFGTTTTVNVTYSLQGIAAPTNVVATAITPTSVSITWSGTAGVTYEVLRLAAGGASSTIGSSSSGSLTDTTASANTAYMYQGRAIAPSVSGYSDPDLATTVIFTDPSLVVGTTVVKAAHFTELRTAVDAVRALAGLGVGSYTDPTLSPGVTLLMAKHFTDLRNALVAARNALVLPPTIWPVIVAGTTISAAEINDLRAGVR